MAQGKIETLYLALIGSIGSGKSSTANTIVKRQIFKRSTGSIRITKEVKPSRAPFPNVNFFVVDTPGLEKEGDFDRFKPDIVKMAHGHRIVYALVVRIGRISKEEIRLLEYLMKKKKELSGNTILIFTNAKELANEDNKAANITFDTWLADAPSLKKLVDDYKVQYLQFENVNASEEEKKSNVNDLLMLLQLPFNSETSEQAHPLIDFNSDDQSYDDREEATISLTKSQIREQFGNAGEDFFEKKQKTQK